MSKSQGELKPLGVDVLDDRVRARLAEIRAAAGVSHSQVSMEVLFFLPKGFLQQYEDMFTRAVKADAGESARADQQEDGARLGKTAVKKTGAGPTVGGGGKRYKRTFVVLDEKALNLKGVIDKRLRSMGRDIAAALAGVEVEGVEDKCSSCGVFMHEGWRFCPKDGTPRRA